MGGAGRAAEDFSALDGPVRIGALSLDLPWRQPWWRALLEMVEDLADKIRVGDIGGWAPGEAALEDAKGAPRPSGRLRYSRLIPRDRDSSAAMDSNPVACRDVAEGELTYEQVLEARDLAADIHNGQY
jgi:hypothetical protein